jgi:hypothetical protein
MLVAVLRSFLIAQHGRAVAWIIRQRRQLLAPNHLPDPRVERMISLQGEMRTAPETWVDLIKLTSPPSSVGSKQGKI